MMKTTKVIKTMKDTMKYLIKDETKDHNMR
jgi:hypothetical protein